MNDSITNWNGAGGGVTFSPAWSVDKTTPAQQKETSALLKDSISSSTSQTYIEGTSYHAAMEVPALQKPEAGAGGGSATGKSSGLADLQFLSQTTITDENLGQLVGKMKEVFNNLGEGVIDKFFGDTTSKAIITVVGSLSSEQLQAIAAGASPEEVKGMIEEALLSLPPEVQKVLLKGGSVESLVQTLANAIEQIPPGALDALASLSGTGLTAEQLEGLLFSETESTPLANPLAIAITGMIDGMSVGELKLIGNGESVERTKGMLFFAATHPDVPMPAGIEKSAAEIVLKAENKSGTKFGSEAALPFDTVFTQMEGGAFAQILGDKELSAQDQALLSQAIKIPSLAAALPPGLKKILDEVKEGVYQAVRFPIGVPRDWSPPGNKDFEQKLGDQFGADLTSRLNDLLAGGTIDLTQYNQLNTDYFFGQEIGKNSPLSGVIEDLKKSLGMPQGYQIPVDAELYQASLNGATLAAFKKKIESAQPPLNAAQQQQLMAALGSPAKIAELPSALRSTFDSAMVSATKSVSAEYHLSSDWKPNLEALAIGATKITTPQFVLQQNAINYGTEALGLSRDLVAEILKTAGPSAQTISINSFMSTVSAALVGLQNQLFSNSVADAKSVQRLNMVQNDSKMAELLKQRKQMEEMKAKMEKQATVGGAFMWIFMVFFFIIMIPLLIMMMMSAKKGKSMDASKGPLAMAMEHQSPEMKKMLMTIQLVFMCVVAPGCVVLLMLLDTMFSQGQAFLGPMLTNMGVSPEAVEKALMAAQMITMALTLGLILIAMAFPPVGMAMAQMLAGLVQAVASAVASMTSVVSVAAAAAVSAMETALIAVTMAITSALAALGPIGTAVATAINTCLTILFKVLRFVIQTIELILNEVITLIGKIVITLAGSDIFLKEIAAVIQPITAQAKAIVMPILQQLSTTLTTAMPALSKIGKAIDAVMKALSQMMDNLSSGMDDIATAVEKGAAKIGDKTRISQAIEKVSDNVADLVWRIGEKLQINTTSEVRNLEGGIQQTATKLEAAQKELTALKDVQKKLMDDVLSGADDGLKKELREVAVQIEKAQQELGSLTQALGSKTAEVEQLTKEVAALAEKVEKPIMGMTKAAKADLKEATGQLEMLKNQRDELAQLVESKTSELNKSLMKQEDLFQEAGGKAGTAVLDDATRSLGEADDAVKKSSDEMMEKAVQLEKGTPEALQGFKEARTAFDAAVDQREAAQKAVKVAQKKIFQVREKQIQALDDATKGLVESKKMTREAADEMMSGVRKELDVQKEAVNSTKGMDELSSVQQKMKDAANTLEQKAEGMGLDSPEAFKQSLKEANEKLVEAAQKQDGAMKSLYDSREHVNTLMETKSTLLDQAVEQSVNSGAKSRSVAEQEVKALLEADQKVTSAMRDMGNMQQDLAQQQKTLQMVTDHITATVQLVIKKVNAIITSVSDTMQAGVSINNSILEGQIALIKGDMEAYSLEAAAAQKAMQNVINNLLEEMKSLNEWISRLTHMLQSWMQGMSNSMSRLTGG